MNETLSIILASFGDPEAPNTDVLDRRIVLGWMQAQDVNTMGAMYSLLLKRNYTCRIEPPLAFEDYQQLFLRFFEQCIREDSTLADDPDSFVLHRYIAAHEFNRWFSSAFQDENIPRHHIDDIKGWLKKLYIGGSPETKACIETVILTHLFRVEKIRRYFSDWSTDQCYRRK